MSVCVHMCVCGGGRKINWTELQTSIILTGEEVNLNVDVGGQGAQDRFFFFFFCLSWIDDPVLTCLVDYYSHAEDCDGDESFESLEEESTDLLKCHGQKVLAIDTWSNISPIEVDNIPYDFDGLFLCG